RSYGDWSSDVCSSDLVGAESLLEQRPGRLAGTKARDLDLAGELLERGVDRRFEFRRRNADVQLDLRRRRNRLVLALVGAGLGLRSEERRVGKGGRSGC